MQLEFQKVLSVMDLSLVLPHAARRAKLHAALAARRTQSERRTVNAPTLLLLLLLLLSWIRT